MARSPRRRRVGALSGAMAAVLAGCGGDAGGGGCAPITREALDPAYLVHVLGDDADLEYRSDPPTSGPHQPSPEIDGVVDEPIPRPVQVGILERGDVLVQHDPDLGGSALTDLEEMAGGGVVVAPNPDLPEPIVATAWLFKRTCEEVDVPAIEAFIESRRGKGPEQ